MEPPGGYRFRGEAAAGSNREDFGAWCAARTGELWKMHKPESGMIRQSSAKQYQLIS